MSLELDVNSFKIHVHLSWTGMGSTCAIWIFFYLFFLLQLLLPYNLQVIFSHNAQQESAAARLIYLAEAWLVGLKNTDSTFLASGDGARRGKCHPVSLAVSSISLSQTTATLMLKQVMVTSFCVAPEKMHHPLSIPNNEFAQLQVGALEAKQLVMKPLLK